MLLLQQSFSLGVSKEMLIEAHSNFVYFSDDIFEIVVQASFVYILHVRVLHVAAQLADHELNFLKSLEILFTP